MSIGSMIEAPIMQIMQAMSMLLDGSKVGARPTRRGRYQTSLGIKTIELRGTTRKDKHLRLPVTFATPSARGEG